MPSPPSSDSIRAAIVGGLAWFGLAAPAAAQTQSGHFCTACFDGNYPIEMDESVRSSKLMLEPAGLAAAR